MKDIFQILIDGDVDGLRCHIANRPQDIEARLPNGATPVLAALHYGRQDMVSALILAGADLNAVDLGGAGASDYTMSAGSVEQANRLRTFSVMRVAEAGLDPADDSPVVTRRLSDASGL